VAGLMMINRSTMTYQSRRDPQDALRMRLHQLAANRVRFGYRRLTVMLRREGWKVNPKRIYRLYTADGLAVRTKVRKKIARRTRVPLLRATRPNEKWSMDFVAARLLDGRWFRVLTVVDQFTRECVLLLADSSLNGSKAALALSQATVEREAPVSITVDNGTEFVSKAMEGWAYQHGVQLDFIRPGRPVENSYIESFNGRLRDECLNVEVFFTIVDVREKLERWRMDYNQVRPHSALDDQSPRAFAATWVENSARASTTSPANNAPACVVRSASASDAESGQLFVRPSAAVKGTAEKLVTEGPPITTESRVLLEVLT